ncbi:MAG: TerB family tellurite resistance protein [Planctomycetes bacterium]|nr:TerB family tellurite resistance protein [Planctomycetota bacterium]
MSESENRWETRVRLLPQNQESVKRFFNLAVLAWIDGNLDERELEFLRAKQAELEIPEEEARRILSLVFGGRQEPLAVATDEERDELLADAIQMVLADGILHQKEYEMLVALGAKMKLAEAEVSSRVEAAIARARLAKARGRWRLSARVVDLLFLIAAVAGIVLVDLFLFM